MAASAHAAEVAPGCGSLENPFGPYDYRTASQKTRLLVEKHHFTSDVEFLQRKAGLGGALDYTLRVFPNHPRALISLMNLAIRDKTNKLYQTNWSVECYFIRGEAFRPDDATVKMVHGIYLMKTGRLNDAIPKLESARALNRKDANVAYNLGLAYFELGQYDRALENAHEAYALGFPLPGLKDMLVKAGKWQEPTAMKSAASPADGQRAQ